MTEAARGFMLLGVALCPACHATVERLQRMDRYLPPLLLTLWREQHPDAVEQLAFALETTATDPARARRE